MPLSPPQALGGTARWVSHAAHVIQTVRPALILTAEPYRQLLEAASQEAGHHSGILTAPPTAPAAGGPQDVAETALIQSTSGSRAAARGVPVSAANLETNIHMIHRISWATSTPSGRVGFRCITTWGWLAVSCFLSCFRCRTR
ncbi:hypothetical protein V2I01_17675 [Micromonospora sp. BRA006-A]|nr:hypothetical protein [Micromonospora sp. BRA006-A]